MHRTESSTYDGSLWQELFPWQAFHNAEEGVQCLLKIGRCARLSYGCDGFRELVLGCSAGLTWDEGRHGAPDKGFGTGIDDEIYGCGGDLIQGNADRG